MAYTHGGDVRAMERVAARLRAQARHLEAAGSEAARAVAALRGNWSGEDHEALQRSWRASEGEVRAAALLVREMAAELERHSAEQERASAATTPGGGAETPGPSGLTEPAPPLDEAVPGSGVDIPFVGDDSPWTPQGLAITADGTLMITTLYHGDDPTQGLLVIQDRATGEVLSSVSLSGIDHYGGVAVHGDHVWVSGGGSVQLYSLSALQGAPGGGPAEPLGTFDVEAHSSVTYHDGHLWVAEFTKPGDGPGSIYSYPVGAGGEISSCPDSRLAGEERMQGIAVSSDHIYVSQSYDKDLDSDLTRIDRDPALADGGRETIAIPSNMAEGIALHGDQLTITYESAAEQYFEDDDDSDPRTSVSTLDLDPEDRSAGGRPAGW